MTDHIAQAEQAVRQIRDAGYEDSAHVRNLALTGILHALCACAQALSVRNDYEIGAWWNAERPIVDAQLSGDLL